MEYNYCEGTGEYLKGEGELIASFLPVRLSRFSANTLRIFF